MTKTYTIAAIPADGIGVEVIAAGIEVLDALAEKTGSFDFKLRPFRLGLRLLQDARRHDAGRRPRADPEPRRDLLRRRRRAGRARPHHPLGPAARDLPALRPVRQRPADPDPAGHHQPAAPRLGPGTRLGDRARELGGRICRRRRPRAPGPCQRGRHRRLDDDPGGRRPHHPLRVQARAVPAAQAADRRDQVERAAPRHGHVGRDRRRGRARTFRT